MATEIDSLNLMHFDILREIGNIGAGNAVTALSKLLGKKIDMKVPNVNLLDFKDTAEIIGGAENLIIGILISLSGDVSGIMMFILEKDSARMLINNLLNKDVKDVSDFTEMDLSAIEEIGNILSSSYLSSLGTLTNLRIIPSIPYLSIDMAGAILSVPAIEFGKVADKVLFIESVFAEDDSNVSGYFILVPDLQSFNIILRSLGVE